MIGIDTNLLIRFFTNDDIEQARYAKKLIGNNEIFICKSVLLETEWVLRYTYEFETEVIHNAFESLLGLPNLTVEDPGCIIKAMQWYAQGFDFADAMHLATSKQLGNNFASLDKAFLRKATKMGMNLLTFMK